MSDRRRLYHGPGAPFAAGLAMAGWALAISTFFTIGLLVGGNGPLAASIAQVLALAGVPIALVRLHGGDRTDLGLALPPLLGMAGAILAGAGTWLIAMHLAPHVVRATGSEDAIRELSRELLAGDVAIILLARAVVPAVCEELLHRGLLLGALAPRFGRGLAIAFTTALFALIHLEPARMVSAALVGALAGTMATWGRSIGPAIALHLVNNAVALWVGLGRWPRAHLAAHPDAALAVACGLVGIGLLLAWIGRQRS
jgi:membrane protease YdiL (CAAX protease family)